MGTVPALVVAGFFLLFLHNRNRQESLRLSLRLRQTEHMAKQFADDATRLRKERDRIREQKEELARDNIGLEAFVHETRAIAEERQQMLNKGKQQMEEDFFNISRKIMAEQGRVLREEHAGGLENLLLPVREQLGEFKKRVEDVYARESRDRLSLIKEIEHLKSLNERISQEAVDLTRALQGTNRLQGQWGEMVLERLLEESGLRQGNEFETQVSIRDEKGRLKQPDVVVHLPENRVIIIDSKMSLNDYVEACRRNEPKEQERYLKKHLSSIRKHINGLSGKQYQRLPGLTTPDFVLLFIPVEGAFQAAVARKPDLLTHSLRRRVIIASPSTLLAVLKTVHHIWRMHEQNSNGQLIAKEAGRMYDKFVGFVEAFSEVGIRLEQARQSWQLAEQRLRTGRGNLISRSEGLKNMGVQPGKELSD